MQPLSVRRLRVGAWPALLLAAALCVAVARAGSGQASGPSGGSGGSVRVEGRIVDVRGAGVGPMPVTLHVVPSEGRPLVESGTAAADGAFRFRVTWPGAGAAEDAQLFVSTMYRGVRYATPRFPGRPDSLQDLRLTVYDTAVHNGPPADFHVPARRLFVQAAGAVRAEVLDAVEIVNASDRTWVAGPESRLWRLPLPEGAEAAQVAESELAGAARLEGDTLALYGPVVPGHGQVLLRYFLPIAAGDLRVPLAARTEGMEVLLAEPLSREGVRGLEDGGTIRIGTEAFRRYAGTRLDADHPIRISLGHPRGRRPLLVALAALLFLVIVGGAGEWRMRRDARLAPAPADG